MSTVAYEIVDVFTDRPYAGNPLAVVFGAEALAGDQMQLMAREFNLAETVFVLPSEAGGTYRARIFTPETELPFAGHPSIGAAVTLVRRGLAEAGDMVQECGAGLLSISVTPDSATLTGGTPTLGAALPVGALLDLVGLGADDFAGGSAQPGPAGCGLEFAYLPVRRGALARAWADAERGRALKVTGISVFAWDAEARTAYARVFCPGVSVPEDPATGSAALGLGVWLVANGLLPGDRTSSYTVHQGVEMHRPSLLRCTVTAVGGAATVAAVSGHVVPVARGEIDVPPFIG
ncbi:PhzF family phenazine biosynthesis protein [Amorphoplanes digitatis]|uniref:Trans-2,3-dihydro-3-hydroxyanthranilate isomerase n=1 Tax=Actinoplanes digitatis TaxID=1868 RepID=A0A7W7HS02_9ACTN|nr:PhzF family phenazine biosynthesis protein [Actinoplanes digitatis]MBB4759737.1 trans-2,3-dihydro-3-hydroxyanthranilate isomerase [Actinoplanes digitatis]BFE67661.1 PhzF family phenazine biosynthesis protein [Actinoplanes digitatis]GID96828.1 phenazine biosynthesis protein [Actinoplanes digitatis]